MTTDSRSDGFFSSPIFARFGRGLAACLVAAGLAAAPRAQAVGTWTAMTNAAPAGVNFPLLLTDGTVLFSNGYKLTPDSKGSYLTGTWTLTSPNPKAANHLYFAMDVLRDGRVFHCGGEYGDGYNGELYDPVKNSWALTPLEGRNFLDSLSALLPDGKVLLGASYTATSSGTPIYDPVTNTWAAGAKAKFDTGEGCWLKIGDGSILHANDTQSERFIQSQNQWVSDAAVPAALFSGGETGTGYLLPDGRAIFLGYYHTDIYTPGAGGATGSWVQGPDIPDGNNCGDVPAVMMNNGMLLLTAVTGYLTGTTSFYEYDYTTNAFTAVPTPPSGGSGYYAMFLNLPDGTVMYANGGSRPSIYTPGSGPLAAGKPAITGVAHNADGSYTLTGTLLTGITEGASYGDDAGASTNYPIVRLTSGTNVYYARTSNWSTTNVRMGATPVTTNFRLPPGLPAGTYSVVVTANGNPSTATSLTVPYTTDTAPTVASVAAASPAAVAGMTVNLSVLGADADGGGESNLTYTWTTTASSGSVTLPAFSDNGTNSAKNTTATFYQSGTYTFKVYITDSAGLSTSSTVAVTVGQTLASVKVTPALTNLTSGQTKQLSATGYDQFGRSMSSQPGFSWSLASGGGSVSASGLYTAPASGTAATVTATSGSYSDTGAVYVVTAPWVSADVGATGVAGAGSDSAGVFSVSGSGADIWGTADEFHYVYRVLDGDGTILARVVTQDNTASWAKSGVMIRNSLDAADQYAFMFLTPSNGAAFHYRSTSGASAVQQSQTIGLTTPYWVKLVRSGNTFTAYRSSNGGSWTLQGSTTIAMGSTTYVGLAVSSVKDTVLNTTTFDNVAVTAALNDAMAATPGVAATINVIANDTAGSGTLVVSAVTQGSKGTVVNNADGTVTYTAGANATGQDTFTYTVTDSAGNTASATVRVTIAGIQAWYPFEEGSGTVANDYVSNLDGSLSGTTPPSWSSGIQGGGGLTFDGVSGYVSIPALNLNSNTVTLSGWVKRNGSQSSYAGLIFSRAGGTVSGLTFGTANELRYTWNNSASTYNWSSGLIPPDGTWTFVALVITPTNATIYMKPIGGSMTSATNNVTNAVSGFTGVTCLGQDSTGGRFFKGSMDEVRIHNVALNSTQVAALANTNVSVATAAAATADANAAMQDLSVLGASTAGAESTITYTWSVTSGPAGATFSANGTNAAKTAKATFAAAGTYLLSVTMTDGSGSTTSDSVSVTVDPVFTGVAVTPAAVVIAPGGTQAFAASAVDQFGVPMASQPTFTWSNTGSGSVTSAGVYTAPATAGSDTVRATSGGITGSASVTFYTGDGVWINGAGGSWPTSLNWSGNNVANGADKTADFGTLNLTADATVTLDGSHTIGKLVFGDTTPSNDWTLASGSTGTLTLDVSTGKPPVTVNNRTATITAVVAGTKGLQKEGAGTLVLSGADTYTGGTLVNAGTLIVGNNTLLNSGGSGGITVATGATLQLNAGASGSYPNCPLIVNGAGSAATTGLYLNAGVTHNAQAKITLQTAPTTVRTAGTGSAQIAGYDIQGTMFQTVAAASGSVIVPTINIGGSGYGVNFSTAAGTATATGDLEIDGDLLNVGVDGYGIYFNGTGSVLLRGASASFTNNSRNKLAVTTGTLILGGSSPFAGGSYGGAITLSSAAKLKYDRTAAAQTFGGVISGNGSVTKSNTGTLTLAGANTYTGTTTVTGGTLAVTGSLSTGAVTVNGTGTLAGTGTIGGAVTVASGGTLSPGVNGLGGLKVNSTLSLAGATLMTLGKTGGTLSADTVSGITTVTYGGTLTVANAGTDTLAVGDTFRLFSATTYAGSFAAVNLPSTSGWDTSRLGVDGTVSVRALTARESWRLANFGTVLNSGTAADTVDPDGDGISNLLEYAYGSNPNTADAASAAPTVSVSGDNLVLSYYQSTSATDVTFTVEQSVDMTNWSTVTATPTVIPAGTGLNLVQVAVPIAGRPSLMLRLRVTAP